MRKGLSIPMTLVLAACCLERAALAQFRLSAMVETDDGIRVGIIDNRSHPPKSYYLRMNEAQSGLELQSAYYDEGLAQIRVDKRILWLSLTGDADARWQALARGSREDLPYGEIRLSAEERMRRAFGIEEPVTESEPAPLSSPPEKLSPAEVLERLHEIQKMLIRELGPDQPLMPIPISLEVEEELRALGVDFSG
jgi:hypothetical protein